MRMNKDDIEKSERIHFTHTYDLRKWLKRGEVRSLLKDIHNSFLFFISFNLFFFFFLLLFLFIFFATVFLFLFIHSFLSSNPLCLWLWFRSIFFSSSSFSLSILSISLSLIFIYFILSSHHRKYILFWFDIFAILTLLVMALVRIACCVFQGQMAQCFTFLLCCWCFCCCCFCILYLIRFLFQLSA